MTAAALRTDHQPRRAHSRLRLGIPARLLSLDGQQWVTLVDLSQSGARVVLAGPATVSGGLLRWLGFEAFGDPAWQLGDELALRFDEPIDPAWLLETRQRAPLELDRARHVRRAAREWVSGRVGFGTER
jgi:hypothetical protein